MTERPILFAGAMVRAILSGRKTQTRRVVTPAPEPCTYADGYAIAGQAIEGNPAVLAACPYGVAGDRLWVRETWAQPFLRTETSTGVIYLADGPDFLPLSSAAHQWTREVAKSHWRPSIFMPRWASRLTLEVVAVRVEQLQEITKEDARAEGVTVPSSSGNSVVDWFACRWDELYEKRAPWSSNPWVWAITFRRVAP